LGSVLILSKFLVQAKKPKALNSNKYVLFIIGKVRK
jgi:hypothetical protein